MENGFVLLTEKDAMWAEMLMEVLRDNGITCVSFPVYGAVMTLRGGKQERLRVYVPEGSIQTAEDLMRQLFPADVPDQA